MVQQYASSFFFSSSSCSIHMLKIKSEWSNVPVKSFKAKRKESIQKNESFANRTSVHVLERVT